MIPLGATTDILTKAVKNMGPITVGFFMFMAFFLYMVNNFLTGATNAHENIVHAQESSNAYWIERVNTIESKNTVSAYLLSRICINSATTEAQRIACSVPPTL